METVSTDTKLRLVQKIREENQENRRKMRSREQLLNYPAYDTEKGTEADNLAFSAEAHPFLGLRIRIALALFFFLGFLLLDYTKMQIGTVSADYILSLIEEKPDFSAEGLLKEVYSVFNGENP